MEKYSKFRDESTGIAPFQEAKAPPLGLCQAVSVYIFGVFSSLLSLINSALYFFIIKPSLPVACSRLFSNYAVMLPLRMLYISFSYEGEHRASVRQKQIRKAEPGDVSLSNFTSPLDPSVYESQQKTHFAFPTLDGHFEAVSTMCAMSRALTISNTKRSVPDSEGAVDSTTEQDNSSQKSSDRAKQAGALLVVFVEGTTTNGRGLLTLKHSGVREITGLKSQVYPVAIRYTPAVVVTPVPASFIGYVWRLSHMAWFYMASARLSGQPIAQSSLNSAGIGKAISAVGRSRILGDRLDAKSKQEYIDMRKNRK